MSGDDDHDEVAELRQGLAELREAYEELREASTAREREDARGDIADARADLDKIAAATGVSRKAIEHAMAEAKRAERREELTPIVAEIVAKMREDDEAVAAAATAVTNGNGDTPKDKKKDPPAPPPPPEPDTAPRGEHWSERRVSELLS